MPDNIEPTLLDQLQERRAKKVEKWGELIAARETERAEFEARDNVTDEDIETYRNAEEVFKAESDQREAVIKELDERVRTQKELVSRRNKSAKASKGAIDVKSEPLTYRRDNSRDTSYFRDLTVVMNSDASTSIRTTSLPEARDRLFRHAMEMDVEMPKLAEAREKRAAKQIEKAEGEVRRSLGITYRGMDFSPFERRVTPNRTDGQGGYFVPPLWVSEYIAGLRSGRVAAGLPRQMDLPPGTDSINVPKLSNLTTVAIQGADNAPVASTDFTDTAVTANIKTLAGQADVAIQLLEQSPYSIDDVLITDLTADYNKKLDLQVLAGTGGGTSIGGGVNSGQLLGLYPSTNWTSTNSVTYTDASPAAWKFFSVAGAMVSNIAENRFLLGPSMALIVHPRRAFWFASGTDSNNRPLVESSDFGPFNVQAVEVDSIPAEGLVARLPWGTPVYADPNITTSDATGGGSSQDVAIAGLFDDVWLFEGEMRTRVLPEILSGTLAVRFQVYNYVAMLVRYGQSLAIATGSGFAAPTGAVSSVTF